MSPIRDLPPRPSLDSLRKHAKKLARDAAAGHADARARIQAQLPRARLPISTRDAQLVVAREYGFAGWSDLTAEVQQRLGRALEWAAAQAKVAIHDQDHERLRALLTEYPALVSRRDEAGETLLSATLPYALDCADPERERLYTRPRAAEMLLDAGAVVEPSMWEYLIHVGAANMLRLLARKQVLPRTLPVLAALGDEEGVRARVDAAKGLVDGDALASATTPASMPDDRQAIGCALLTACRFNQMGIARRLLEHAIAIDPDLGRRIDQWDGREAFLDFLRAHPASWGAEGPETAPWQALVMRQLTHALDGNELAAFRQWLEQAAWVLEPSFMRVQITLIERACWSKNRGAFIAALLDADPALLRATPPPPSAAIVHALSYGNAHLVPMLTRIWPLSDDLPHAAGTGNMAAVQRWFDGDGRLALGSLAQHYPGSDPRFKAADLGWGPATPQQVLDVALAWAVLNRQFEIAAFLLARGADINTTWSTHEPASILHECALQGNEEGARFLIDHGADLTRTDHRYQSTAEGWARYAARDERMAALLADAAGRRGRAG